MKSLFTNLRKSLAVISAAGMLVPSPAWAHGPSHNSGSSGMSHKSSSSGVIAAPNGNTGYSGIGLPKPLDKHNDKGEHNNGDVKLGGGVVISGNVTPAPNGNTGVTGIGLPKNTWSNKSFSSGNASLGVFSSSVNQKLTNSGIIIIGGKNAALNSTMKPGDAVTLNPQPLPPKVLGQAVMNLGDTVTLNPQPLPPKIGIEVTTNSTSASALLHGPDSGRGSKGPTGNHNLAMTVHGLDAVELKADPNLKVESSAITPHRNVLQTTPGEMKVKPGFGHYTHTAGLGLPIPDPTGGLLTAGVEAGEAVFGGGGGDEAAASAGGAAAADAIPVVISGGAPAALGFGGTLSGAPILGGLPGSAFDVAKAAAKASAAAVKETAELAVGPNLGMIPSEIGYVQEGHFKSSHDDSAGRDSDGSVTMAEPGPKVSGADGRSAGNSGTTGTTASTDSVTTSKLGALSASRLGLLSASAGKLSSAVATKPTTPDKTLPAHPNDTGSSHNTPFPFPLPSWPSTGPVTIDNSSATDATVPTAELSTDARTPAATLSTTMGADLVLEDIKLAGAATLIAGPAYTVKFRNQGTATAGTFQVAILAGLDGKLTEDAPRAVLEVPSLVAGEAKEVTLRLPQRALRLAGADGRPAAFTHLFIAVDLMKAVAETDETNNTAVVERAALEGGVAAN